MKINFHVYEFILNEIDADCKYFTERGIRFVPMLAYFNDYYLFESYLNKTMEKDIVESAKKHLMTDLLKK